VVLLQDSTATAGGAANVAVNVAGLGAQAKLAGLTGRDEEGRELARKLEQSGVSPAHLLAVEGRPTTVKTRLVAQGQHIARLDCEDATPIGEDLAEKVAAEIISLLPETDVLVFSDYGKGLLAPTLLARVIAAARARNLPVLVDPKGRDYARYAGATILTPNRHEAAHAANIEDVGPETTLRAGAILLERLAVEGLLVTQGEDGMTLFRRQAQPEHLPARARAVYDVTGAGDTVIATLAVALGAGADWLEAAQLANTAAGLVVEQVGTTAITLPRLSQALEEHAASAAP
jgi:D-beta-D-heptose 7-phosphate kinase/D-beta-D-heptose 1-phosphate adenosyltransferase